MSAAMRAGIAAPSIFSCVARAVSRIAETLPSRITTMRSLMPSTSGISEETMMIPYPRLGQLVHDLEDRRLGAHVDALRRLVQDDHLHVPVRSLATMTFCWLPPDRVATRSWTLFALTSSLSASSLA